MHCKCSCLLKQYRSPCIISYFRPTSTAPKQSTKSVCHDLRVTKSVSFFRCVSKALCHGCKTAEQFVLNVQLSVIVAISTCVISGIKDVLSVLFVRLQHVANIKQEIWNKLLFLHSYFKPQFHRMCTKNCFFCEFISSVLLVQAQICLFFFFLQ